MVGFCGCGTLQKALVRPLLLGARPCPALTRCGEEGGVKNKMRVYMCVARMYQEGVLVCSHIQRARVT